MLKKTCILILALTLLLSSAAIAEVTNLDMQMYGGVLVSNSNASFFFAPMETGVTRHWGLYSTAALDVPLVEITEGIPARLVHADSENVYFFGYDDPQKRETMTLYSVNISTGANEALLTDVAHAYTGESADTFLYVTASDKYTLHSYSIKNKKATKIKDMSASDKSMYDAMEYKGNIYFITLDKNNKENAYQYHASNGKATNIDAPNPSATTSMLYEGYRVYSTESNGTNVYSVKIANKKGTAIGSKYNISLSSPRFGEAMYTYDTENHKLVCCPLDGSAEKTLDLEGDTVTRFILGGTKDELLLMNNGAIYAIAPNLSSQNKILDFSASTGGQIFSHVVPAGTDKIAVFGYGAETFTHTKNMLPTGVYILDRATGEILFGFPDAATEAPTAGDTSLSIGDVPMDIEDDGETHFF